MGSLIKPCAEYNSPFYLTFLSSEFIETVLVTFDDVILAAFVNTLSVAFML